MPRVEGDSEIKAEEVAPSLPSLAPHEEALFRAFQSNLLSLISHEVRTPLTGILNALEALGSGGPFDKLSMADFIQMARQNALKLNQVLLSLLDLASLESGTFRARLREVELQGFIQGRLESYQVLFRENQLGIQLGWEIKREAEQKIERAKKRTTESEKKGRKKSKKNFPSELVAAAHMPLQPLLADPQKLTRAIDLCFQIIVPRAQSGTAVKIRISSDQMIQFEFQIQKTREKCWQHIWAQSLTGFYNGAVSPYAAFAGVLQSERAFLTRTQEGLGSELFLIHEIMRVHHGKFSSLSGPEQNLILSLEFPILSPEESLNIVLGSRTEQLSLGLGSMALVLLKVPADTAQAQFLTAIKKNLFRTTDTAYALPDLNLVALVLDDCREKDILPLIKRIQRSLKLDLSYGIAHCPNDGYDPFALFQFALRRLGG